MRIKNPERDSFDFFYFRQALGVALAAALMILIIVRFNLSNGFLGVIMITVVPFLYRQAIVKMGWQRFLGAGAGLAVGCVIFALVNTFSLSLLAFFIAILIASCLFSLRIYPYAFLIMSVTLALHFLFGFSNINAGTDFVYDWFLYVGLGLLVILFVKTWVVRDRIQETFAYEKQKFLDTLKALCQNPEKQAVFPSNLIKKLDAFASLYLEKDLWTYHAKRLCAKLEIIHSHYAFLKSVEPLAPFFEACFYNFFSPSKKKALLDLDNAFETLCHEGYFKGFTSKDLLLVKRLRLHCHECYKEQESIEAAAKASIISSKPFPSISMEQFRLALVRGIKISLALMVGISFSLYTGVVGGIQTLFTIILFAAQPNLAKASLWTVMRFGGVCIGTGLSIFYLLIISHVPSLWVLISLYSFSILVLYYIGYSAPSYGYVFLQIGLALTLVFLIDLNALANIDIAIKRFIGVVGGCVIGVVLSYVIDPETPLQVAKKACSAQLEIIADHLKASFIENKPQQMSKNLLEAISLKELSLTFGVNKDVYNHLAKHMGDITAMYNLLELMDPSRMLDFPKLEKEDSDQLHAGVQLLIDSCKNKISPDDVLRAHDIFRELLNRVRKQHEISPWPIARASVLFDTIFTLEECCRLVVVVPLKL